MLNTYDNFTLLFTLLSIILINYVVDTKVHVFSRKRPLAEILK